MKKPFSKHLKGFFIGLILPNTPSPSMLIAPTIVVEVCMLHRIVGLSCVAVALLSSPLKAETSLPEVHPLVGLWRINLPEQRCSEIYDIRTDGTAQILSGGQVVKTRYDISLTPNPQGFYTWVDTVVQVNSEPDCMGNVVPNGNVATNYIVMHGSGSKFMMCQKADLETCFGPFLKEEGV